MAIIIGLVWRIARGYVARILTQQESECVQGAVELGC